MNILFFKKKKKVENKISTKKYSSEIEEIHNEFNSASDKLLEEAKSIIDNAQKANTSKISRLEALGFKQSNEVKELKPLLEKSKFSKEQIDLLNYYRKKYPFNKFITENQVKEICHKYNLVCGDVSRFKGFVPEKNLKEIEAFKLKDEDSCIQGICWGNDVKPIKKYIPYNIYLKAKKENEVRGDDKHLDINLPGTDNRYIRCDWIRSNYDSSFTGRWFDRIEKMELQICAPVKDMDISDLELKEGYKLEKKFVPDPVVLQPVKGGYLIITAWGDEASDPIVVNEINN